MSDNRLSYTRFSAMPANIAVYGATREELSPGKPDKDPNLSPMAATRIPEAKLSLASHGSDRLRLAVPQDPVANPYEGPKPALVLTRSAVRKLESNVLGQLQSLVTSVPDQNLQDRMQDSLRRVAGLRASVSRLNDMAEFVMVRTRADCKG